MKKLTDELFEEYMRDEKKRREVAFASGAVVGGRKFLRTVTYPRHEAVEVTQVQVDKAWEILRKAAEALLEEKRKTLLFVGMGMVRDKVRKGRPNNYRFRTRLENLNGENIFIEFSHYRKHDGREVEGFGVDHCFEDEDYGSAYRARERDYVADSEVAILTYVNRHLRCKFRAMHIDYYTLDNLGKDPICFSPKPVDILEREESCEKQTVCKIDAVSYLRRIGHPVPEGWGKLEDTDVVAVRYYDRKEEIEYRAEFPTKAGDRVDADGQEYEVLEAGNLGHHGSQGRAVRHLPDPDPEDPLQSLQKRKC